MSLLLDEIALATARLAEAGVESPRTDAELIAANVHNVNRGELHLVPDSEFDARFWVDVGRRANREPLQHITGRAYFRYLELDVGPGVFVPRPETEVMTGWAIDRLREMDVAEPVAVDLGTGSGAIALSIAQEVPRVRVHAVEADPLARAWAERNITRYVDSYTAGRVLLHAGDFTGSIPDALEDLAGLAGTVDLVVSNPPYIPVGSIVPPEVGEYDPPAALWGGGSDGLDAVRAVDRVARWLLRPGGLVAVEHGAQQGAGVYWVFSEESGWKDTRNHKDLASRDRFVTAVWAVLLGGTTPRSPPRMGGLPVPPLPPWPPAHGGLPVSHWPLGPQRMGDQSPILLRPWQDVLDECSIRLRRCATAGNRHRHGGDRRAAG